MGSRINAVPNTVREDNGPMGATLAPPINIAALPAGAFGFLHLILFNVLAQRREPFLEFLLPHAQETADLRHRAAQAFIVREGFPEPRHANYLLVKEDPLAIEAPVPPNPPWAHRGTNNAGGRLQGDSGPLGTAMQIFRALAPKSFPEGYAISTALTGLPAEYGLGGKYRYLISYRMAAATDQAAFEQQFIQSAESIVNEGHLSAQPFVVHVGRRFEVSESNGEPKLRLIDTDGSDWAWGRYVMALESNLPGLLGPRASPMPDALSGRSEKVVTGLRALTPKRFTTS